MTFLSFVFLCFYKESHGIFFLMYKDALYAIGKLNLYWQNSASHYCFVQRKDCECEKYSCSNMRLYCRLEKKPLCRICNYIFFSLS